MIKAYSKINSTNEIGKMMKYIDEFYFNYVHKLRKHCKFSPNKADSIITTFYKNSIKDQRCNPR